MKITIFGGGGFIGSTIADRLLTDGHELRIFERPRVAPFREFLPHEKVEWLTGDFSKEHDITNAIDGADVVLHLISSTLPKNSNDDPIYDVETNIVSSLKLLNAMVTKAVKKIVFISSGGTVYGNPLYVPIDEKHPTEPRVSYGITKLAIEKYLLMYQELYGIKANILRVANPFGERQRIETAQGAIGVFLNKIMKNEALEIWGDGTISRDYIHISDVAEAFAKAIRYDGPHSVFNISSGAGTSLNDLITMMEEIVGKKITRNYHPGRPFDVPVSILDNSLAKRELQWEPKMKLKDGIIKTYHGASRLVQ